MSYKIILYYKYVDIENTEALKTVQFDLCKDLDLKGRILIAEEGINGTLEGTEKSIVKYMEILKSDKRFADTHFKVSNGTGDAFPKLSIKIRPEIVSAKLGEGNVNPNNITGKYITAEMLHELFKSKEEFYIIDMRNDYEHVAGHFKNSILPGLRNFRDLPKILGEIEHLKNKKVITVCTGGVRCEKASGYLITKGFKDVSQLYGGIVTYMEKYPNENFLGELYVFDGRVIMGFNMDAPEHVTIAKCEHCSENSTNYVNCNYDPCHKHFVCCINCLDKKSGNIFCLACSKNKVYAKI